MKEHDFTTVFQRRASLSKKGEHGFNEAAAVVSQNVNTSRMQ